MTQSRRDATRDPGSQFIYLRDVRSGAVWSATLPPDGARARRLPRRVPRRDARPSAATTTRSSTQLDIAVSTEDDVEVRRRHGDQPRRRGSARSTSRATSEIVLAPPADDLAHPAFGKLFLETEYLADSAALLCHRRPRDPRDPAVWAVHVLEPRRPAAGPGRVGNRSRALHRPRPRHRSPGRARRPRRCRARPASCSIRSSACASGSGCAPGASVRLCLRHRHRRRSRDRRGARAEVPRPERRVAHLRARLHARAERPAPSRHLERRGAAVRAAGVARAVRRRLAARRRRTRSRANELGQAGLWPHGISGDLPILLVRVVGDDDVRAGAPGAAGAGVLAPEGAAAPTSSSSTSIPSSYLDEMQAQLTALLDNGPWRTWKHRPGGAYLLRADRIGKAERTLLEAVARAVARRRPRRPPRAARPAASGPARGRGRHSGRVAAGAGRAAGRRAAIAPPPLTLANGLGGFADDGRAYAIVLDGDQETPLPWANVIANPQLRHHRHRVGLGAHLVREQPREPADARSPTIRSPIRRPRRSSFATTTRATPGRRRRDRCARDAGERPLRHPPRGRRHAVLARSTRGIRHELDVFVDADDPVKFSLLTLTNDGAGDAAR